MGGTIARDMFWTGGKPCFHTETRRRGVGWEGRAWINDPRRILVLTVHGPTAGKTIDRMGVRLGRLLCQVENITLSRREYGAYGYQDPIPDIGTLEGGND